MAIKLSPSEQLTYSTVRIECELNSGGIGTGTGFFYRFAKKGEQFVPAIVTNKHVVNETNKGLIHLNLADDTGNPLTAQFFSVVIENMQSSWILHPDPDVDLCIMPIAPLLNELQSHGKRMFFISLDHSLVPTTELLNDLTAIEDVIMIGYPNGIWDKINNRPIVRKGITATHPRLDYNGKQEFMIDAACFPGSSGSPVFLFNLGSYASRDGGTVIGSRIALLGVLYAGPQHTATGEVKIIDVPTQQRSFAFSLIPNNLGIVIKSKKLGDFDPILEEFLQRQADT
jgi:hypothetical protein